MTDQQFKSLWKLNKVGSAAETKSIVTYQINRQEYCDDILIDFDYIYKKYIAYKKFWYHKNGNRDPKYISNSDKFKSINDFIRNSMFREEFEIDKKSVDYYLAISLVNKQELERELKEFLNDK